MLDQQYDTFHNGSWVHLTINGEYGPPSGPGAPRSLLPEGLLEGKTLFAWHLLPVPTAERRLSTRGPLHAPHRAPRSLGQWEPGGAAPWACAGGVG